MSELEMINNIHADEVERAAQDPQQWRSFVEKCELNLSEVDFTGMYLTGLDFSKCDLESCSFEKAYIKDCDFARSNLYAASFEGAEVDTCSFLGALLSHSILNEADFTKCDFTLSELTQASSIEASFDSCDISRARGVSQDFLDASVGSGEVVIPQSLDYPAHWLRSEEDRRADELFQQLRAFRGDEVLLCSFDGRRLVAEQVASRDKSEISSALAFLQKQLGYLVEERFLHNEAPKMYRALQDYYEVVTQNAGEDKSRWPKKLYEIDEIKLGLQGNCLSAYLESSRMELKQHSPEKLPILEQILSSHFILAANLDRWRSFVDSAIDAKLSDDQIDLIEKFSEDLLTRVSDKELFDPEIPKTVRTLRLIFDRPKDAARMAAFGVVRCVESILGAMFTFCRRFILKSADGLVEDGSRVAVRAVLATLVAIGAANLFSTFPNLSTWITGGISALRAIGILQ